MVDSRVIIETLKQWIQDKHPVHPTQYLDGALKLAVLMGDETSKLFDLELKVAKIRASRMESGETAAKAKIMTEATEEYRSMRVQKAFTEQISEFIMIAKKYATISDNEYSRTPRGN